MTEQDELVRAALPAYDIGAELGRGGCGVVLAGTHRRLGRPVAIKQIPPQFAHDEQVRRRFVAEARVLAAIDHPHVVRVFDYLEHGELCLLVMEYLPGGTVGERFATDGYDSATAVAIALSCAAGLAAAHRHRVLHRDVKPANLMFGAGGAIKLTDFGIAKIVGGDETWVTKAGDIIGTPSYIAPEQARGQQLSPATDVYALATMLYQLLSGVLPFPPGDGPLAMLFAHAFDEPTPLSAVASSVPEPIAAVVMRGLATDPADRFDSAESFGIALAQPAAYCWGEDWLTPVGIPVIGADTIVAAATGSGRMSSRGAGGHRRTPPVTPGPLPGIQPYSAGGKALSPSGTGEAGGAAGSTGSLSGGTGPTSGGTGSLSGGAGPVSGRTGSPSGGTGSPSGGTGSPSGGTGSSFGRTGPLPGDNVPPNAYRTPPPFRPAMPSGAREPTAPSGSAASGTPSERGTSSDTESLSADQSFGAAPPTTPWFPGGASKSAAPSEGSGVAPPFGPALESEPPRSTAGSAGNAPPTVQWYPAGSRPEAGPRPPTGPRPVGGHPTGGRPSGAFPPAGARPPVRPAAQAQGAMPFRGPVTRVRPLQPVPDNGARLAEIDRRDLVLIQEVVNFESPRVPFALAAVLAIAAVVLVVSGFGQSSIGGDLAPGAVALGGVDPATTPVEVDLTKPIPLRVNGIDADAASLKVTVLGLPLVGEVVPFVPGEPGATLPAPVNQYVMAGHLTGELVLLRNNSEIATERVEMQAVQRPATTVTAASVVLLALFSLAYLESNMRRLRRGRGGFANTVGLIISAALLAVALVGGAWILLGHPPQIATTAGSAALAAAAGLAVSFGARRIGKRRRYLRRARRQR
ncbi:protein kinase [Nocardia suismassiliense]|uniref:non-specific serine/threonine protein kinase n=1 Tax=Nocardia suismassiliense TaxID=2077092 RepID=A0ABW6QY74_9NOCA